VGLPTAIPPLALAVTPALFQILRFSGLWVRKNQGGLAIPVVRAFVVERWPAQTAGQNRRESENIRKSSKAP